MVSMVDRAADIAALADTFKALSDETRLLIMALLLQREELCVCDIVGTLGLMQSKVSRHLRYLFNAGLVETERDGRWMHYRVSGHLSADKQAVVDSLLLAISSDRELSSGKRLDKWLEQKAAASKDGERAA
jgi:DNA-binding transcriptional ArsR family regulator